MILLKLFLFGVIAFLLYQSPDARNATADLLRTTADVVDTHPQSNSNPKNFVIPNPFHHEDPNSRPYSRY